METIKCDFSVILAVYFACLMFGMGYNVFIERLSEKGYLEGFISLVVAGGVLITLALTAIISWQCTLIVLGAFVASGVPMILGSIWRYVKAREADQNDARQA